MDAQKVEAGLDKLKTATRIRREISAIYTRYRGLTRLVETYSRGKIKHFDVKRAVDAIHYFGGGWPFPNSKGRMEALLDAFAGMYKVLSFIGQGGMVKRHLAKHGITIHLQKKSELKNSVLSPEAIDYLMRKYRLEKVEDLQSLLEQVVMVCDDLQTDICNLADQIKCDLRPAIQGDLEIEDPEYKRLVDVMKLKMGSDKTSRRVPGKIKHFGKSITNYSAATQAITGKVSHEPTPGTREANQ